MIVEGPARNRDGSSLSEFTRETGFSSRQGNEARVRIWDLPVRLFHWLIVVLFAFSWWTAETDRLDWHFISGYAILALLVFRIYWGVVGSTTARFATFVKGPASLLAYGARLFERPGKLTLGHNPMGGWSVLAMLLLLVVQVVLGLFACDVDGLNAGPLDTLVSFDTGRRAAGLHGRVFNILLALIALHVVVVLFYLVYKRENLIAAMIGGYKSGHEAAERALRFVPLWWTIPGLAAGGLLVLWLAYGHF